MLSISARPCSHVGVHTRCLHPSHRTRHALNRRTCSSAKPVSVSGLSGSDGIAPPASQQQAVSWEFEQLGLSKKAVSTILRKCPSYLNWDIEHDLQPAIQQWHDELGPDLEKALRRNPRLLTGTVAACKDHYSWLLSIGVQDPQKVILREPRLLVLKLKGLQDKVDAFMAAGRSLQQVLALLEQHPCVLRMQPQALQEKLDFVAQILEVPVTSCDLLEFVMRVQGSCCLFNWGDPEGRHSISAKDGRFQKGTGKGSQVQCMQSFPC